MLVLLILGISIEQTTIPNQEIVVRFDVASVNTAEAQQAVSEITKQLEAIGVTDVHVSKLFDGKLKVTYYSTIEVSVIKSLLQNQDLLQLKGTAFNKNRDAFPNPLHRDIKTYELDVVQIQKNNGSNIGLQGLPVVLKPAKDQYLKPVLSNSATEISFVLKDFDADAVNSNYRYAPESSNNCAHKIPEVRAGPLS